MYLIQMINTDRVSLECDLAETYHIYEMTELPARKVALFSFGLRENSRIKMKLAEANATLEQILLAGIYDNVSLLRWFQTTDSQKGINRPQSMLEHILGRDKKKEVQAFNSVEEFERARQRILQKVENK